MNRCECVGGECGQKHFVGRCVRESEGLLVDGRAFCRVCFRGFHLERVAKMQTEKTTQEGLFS